MHDKFRDLTLKNIYFFNLYIFTKITSSSPDSSLKIRAKEFNDKFVNYKRKYITDKVNLRRSIFG